MLRVFAKGKELWEGYRATKENCRKDLRKISKARNDEGRL